MDSSDSQPGIRLPLRKFYFWFVLVTLIVLTSGGYIPPTTKYKCPTLSQIWPCVCSYADDFGIRMKCEDVSMATLAAAVQYPARTNIPVLDLHITKLNTEKLYGSLFAGLNVKKIVIEDSPVQKIHSDIFLEVKDYLQDLEIWHSNLNEFPYSALEQLNALVNLTLDSHSISELPQPIKGMTSLKFLRISKGNISVITGDTFKEMPGLDRLDLHRNQLKAIPRDTFKNLRNCRFLDLAFNELTKLDPQNYPQMTKLTWFNASHNLISDFTRGAFARNSFLRVLYLTHNKITKLDAVALRGMTNLRRLYLSDNQIEDVGRGVFSNVKKVGTIDLARNKIKVIDFEMFKQLLQPDEIILSENEITDVKAGAFQELSYVMINISHNAIKSIEKGAFQNCVNVTILDMSYNQISNFTKDVFDENTYPTEWRLQFNKLRHTGDIPLKHMAGIKILNVSYNELVEVSKNTFPKLYELHTVDFSHNNISKFAATVFMNLFSIRYVNMSHNSLTDFGSMGAVPTLLEITFDHNRIRRISPSAFTRLASLRQLSVTFNELKSVFQIPPGLNHLNVSNNEINSLAKAWPTMNALLTLDLSNNSLGGNLERGSFAGLGTLQAVDLSKNGITEIPAEALSDLTTVQHINLEYNSITNISRTAFGRLPVVFTLKLAHNNILEVSVKAFDGLLQLLHLDLSNNHIKRLPEGAFDGLVSLRLLNLSHNHIERTDNGQTSLFEKNLSLETLDLSYNMITEIYQYTFPEDPYIPYRLTTVDLSYNQIVYLGKDLLRGTKKLQRLYLSHNKISEIKPNVIGNMTSLQILDLSYNELPYLARDQLGPPLNLTELNVQFNKLRRFPSASVLPKAPLKLVDLTGNRITLFDMDFLPKIKNGSRIILDKNPLKCDCRLILLKRFYNDFRPKLSNFSEEFYKDFERLKCGKEETHVLVFNERDLICDTTEDLQAPVIPANYDLEIIVFTVIGQEVQLQWKVKTKMDVAGFQIVVKNDSEEEIQKRSYLYNVRSAKLQLETEASEVCLSPRYSRPDANENALKVCQKLSKVSGLTSRGNTQLISSFATMIISLICASYLNIGILL